MILIPKEKTMTVTNSNYKNYFKAIRDAAPESDTQGKVKSTVNFYKNDAFVETPAKKSYSPIHRADQCVRVHQSLNFWINRVNTAKK